MEHLKDIRNKEFLEVKQMKMKQKGIATAAIAVVVIVIIAVAGVGAFLVLRGRAPEGVGGLPKYTGATKADTVASGVSSSTLVSGVLGKGQSVPTGVEYEVYTTRFCKKLGVKF